MIYSSPAQSTHLALLQITLEAEMESPELEYKYLGSNLDGPLHTWLHGCEILRWFIGLQIRNKMGPGTSDGNCLLIMTHRHLKRQEIWISRKPHIFGGKIGVILQRLWSVSWHFTEGGQTVLIRQQRCKLGPINLHCFMCGRQQSLICPLLVLGKANVKC